ncbi:MAG: hypothetical protein KGR26_06550 [Cyanobacteria bacterium REEB65]|nr:hypothetical protein [Cyanobacteria bacterium REEB65]
MQHSTRLRGSLACTGLLAVTALAFGCTDDTSNLVATVAGVRRTPASSSKGSANPSASPTASASASPNATSSASPSASPTAGTTATPTPSPTPTANTGVNVNSGVNSSAPPATVATLPPNNQPAPGPTPVGQAIGQATFVDDPASLAFLASTIVPWVAQPAPNAIALLSTNPQSVSVASSPKLVAAQGATDLWVASAGSSPALWHYSENLLGQMTLSASYSLAAAPAGLAADSTQVWVAETSGTLFAYTVSGNATASYAPLPGAATAIALDSSNAWVTGGSNSLYQVKRSGGTLAQTLAVTSNPTSVAVDGGGAVWVGGAGLSYLPGGTSSPEALNVPGTPKALAYDPKSQTIWAALGGSPNMAAWYAQSTWTLQGTASIPVSPSAMAVDAQGNVWIGSTSQNQVITLWGE